MITIGSDGWVLLCGRRHGFLIFGKKRMIPARVVQRVDDTERMVHVAMSKAPDFHEQHRDVSTDAGVRAPYDTYYGPFGPWT